MNPLPMAPRPFPDEALGSWIGRLAALYRISVCQLDATFRLRLNLDGPMAWLCPVPAPPELAERLAALTHLPSAVVGLLVDTACVLQGPAAAHYCHLCVFLNPVEVESPYWKRAWLEPRAAPCPIHGAPLSKLPAAEVRRAANMRVLIRAVGRLERRRSNAGKLHSQDP